MTIFTVQASPYVRQVLLNIGILKEKVMIAGTGSMYPTFPKGEGKTDLVRASEIVAWPQMRRFSSDFKLFGLNLFSYNLQEGDIVQFENEETKKISQEKYGEEAGFVKRVIGLPQDTIELRDGFVYLNGGLLNEPYIAKGRSTFGGIYLADCQKLTIHDGNVFVMGDNRKASLDSRYDLGLVSISSINYVLPWISQNEYRKLWRDTSADSTLAHTATLDPAEFVKLLNEKREEANLRPYKYNSLLSSSSRIRGNIMLKTDDFFIEATKSGISLEKAVKQSGYQNIIFAETFTRGFYEADELVENFLEFPETKKILFSNDYQDIGLTASVGEINSCPQQMVVVHLGGYVPPNYTKEEIDSWGNLVTNLENVLPSWRELGKAENVDKNKVDTLLNLLETRLNNAKKILSRMKSNQWLSEEEKGMAENDKKLGEEAEKIISELMKR